MLRLTEENVLQRNKEPGNDRREEIMGRPGILLNDLEGFSTVGRQNGWYWTVVGREMV